MILFDVGLTGEKGKHELEKPDEKSIRWNIIKLALHHCTILHIASSGAKSGVRHR